MNPDNPKTIKQIKILIAPYKQKEDGALPVHKSPLLQYYHSIRRRPLRDVAIPYANANDDHANDAPASNREEEYITFEEDEANKK